MSNNRKSGKATKAAQSSSILNNKSSGISNGAISEIEEINSSTVILDTNNVTAETSLEIEENASDEIRNNDDESNAETEINANEAIFENRLSTLNLDENVLR